MHPEERVDWLSRVGDNLWETTRNLHYHVAGREITVPAGFRTDLFTVVGNTEHPELWRSSILHDYILEHPELYPRAVGDVLFLQDMVAAAFDIYHRLQEEGLSEKRARKKMLRIVWLAIRRYMGVSAWRKVKGIWT